MLIAVALSLLVAIVPRESWTYAYENRTGTQRIYVGQHLFQSLVDGKWCFQVYTDKSGVHVCVL